MRKICTFLVLTLLCLVGAKAQEQTATFDFENNPQNWPVGEGANFADGNLTAPLTVGEVTLTNVQGEASQPARIMRVNDGVSALYVYKNGSIKLGAAEGRAVTKIAVTMKSGSFDLTASNGSVADGVWTGNASEVLFSATATRTMLKLEVTTAAENDETVKPVAEVFDAEAATIAEFNALDDGKVVKLALNNAQVNAFDDLFGFYFIEDATGATGISGVQLAVGNVLNGYVIGKKSSSALDWSGEHPDYIEIKLIANSGDTFTAEAGTLSSTDIEVAAIANGANHGRLLTVNNVDIVKEGRFYYAYSGEDKVQVKDAYMVLPSDYEWPEKAKSVTGVATFNGARWQLAPTQAADIVAAVAGESEAVFDFAQNNIGITPGTNGADSELGNLGGVALTQGDVTLTFVNSPTMPTRYYNTARGNHFQMIAGGQLRITAAEGRAITAVTAKPNYTTNPSTSAVVTNVNWTADKGEGTLSTDLLRWTGNAASVRLTGSGATYLDSIIVETAPATAETVVPEADSYVEVATIAEFNALTNGPLAKIALNDAIVSATALGPSRWTIYLQDATAGAHLYCMPFSLQANDVLNGYIYAKKSNQTSGSRIAMTEQTSDADFEVTAGGQAEPVVGTIAEVNVAANLNRVVKVAGVAFAGTSATAATLSDGAGNTLSVTNTASGMSPYVITDSFAGVSYSNVSVTGILYGSTKGNQLYPLTITQIDTAIRDIEADSTLLHSNASIYSLQGTRLSTLQRGINIVGGKKIVVR